MDLRYKSLKLTRSVFCRYLLSFIDDHRVLWFFWSKCWRYLFFSRFKQETRSIFSFKKNFSRYWKYLRKKTTSLCLHIQVGEFESFHLLEIYNKLSRGHKTLKNLKPIFKVVLVGPCSCWKCTKKPKIKKKKKESITNKKEYI